MFMCSLQLPGVIRNKITYEKILGKIAQTISVTSDTEFPFSAQTFNNTQIS